MTKDKADTDPRETDSVSSAGPSNAPPGTTESIVEELNGEANYAGYADIDKINEANRVKNSGLRAALPKYTIDTTNDEAVVLKILHFGVGSIRALQGTETESVRQSLSWKRNVPLPAHGTIEVNARTMCNAIVGCEQGSAVDIDGAIRANRHRNDGLWYIFPANLLPGVEIKLRGFGHPYITVVEADTSERLKARMGIRRNKPLPEFARAEVERVMVLHSIIEAKGKVLVDVDGVKSLVDLGKLNTYDLRAWFEKNLLRPADLRGKVPTKRTEAEAFFKTMYASQNPDVLAAFIDAHMAIRTAENEEILARGDAFRVGADWDYDPGSAVYTPTAEPVNLAAMELGALRELIRDSFFPRANFQTKPPKDARGREEFFVTAYRDFNNGLLNELVELENEIREVDYEALIEGGADFTVGASDELASNG